MNSLIAIGIYLIPVVNNNILPSTLYFIVGMMTMLIADLLILPIGLNHSVYA